MAQNPRTLPTLPFEPLLEGPIVYLNRDSRPDRRRHIEATMERFRIHARRISATVGTQETIRDVDGGKLYARIPQDRIDPANGDVRPLGMVAHYLSCRELIEAMNPESDGYTLFLEDDVDIRHRIFFRFAHRIARTLPHDWDVLLFDCGGPWQECDRVAPCVYRPSAAFPIYWGTHAMLIRHASAPRILHALADAPVGFFDCILLENITPIRTFVIRSGLCRTLTALGSDINPATATTPAS